MKGRRVKPMGALLRQCKSDKIFVDSMWLTNKENYRDFYRDGRNVILRDRGGRG